MHKHFLRAGPLVAAAALGGTPALAQEISANVALTSDYVFRGFSQTDEEPAIQGGFDYEHASGFSAGAWASNVDFDDGDEAHIEIDVYAGYAGSLTPDLGWNGGLIYYAYPGADDDLDYDYWEAYAGLSYSIASLTYYYSPDFFGSTGDGHYIDLGADVTLPYEIGLNLHVGYQEIDDLDSYVDWKVGLARELYGVSFDVSYHDTDENNDLADERVVFTISKDF